MRTNKNYWQMLRNIQDLVALYGQSPLGVGLAVVDGRARVGSLCWTVHGLKEKLVEGKWLKSSGVNHGLRKDKL